MSTITRRGFLLGAAGISKFPGLSVGGLAVYSEVAKTRGGLRPRAAFGDGGYGPLVPAGPELALPVGFQYVKLGVEGTLMSDGSPTPRAHDGMAAFPIPNGNVRLVRNHEDRESADRAIPRGSPDSAYDPRAGGGTTTLEIATHPDGRPELVRDFTSLNGTIYNCAGGPTPWGTWLTCEEITEGPAHGWDRPHGYVFEVDPLADSPVRAEPIWAMGRFVHEAVAVDPATGIVYQTEDRPTAGFYRFLPDHPGRLALGGRLQMLAIAGAPHFNTTFEQDVGRTRRAVWLDIDDPDPPEAEFFPLSVFADGYARGAAVFSRLEGCWYGDGSIYFNATDGGDARAGQVWRYQPTSDSEGLLTLVFESPSRDILDSPDNITVSPRGGLVVCEDSDAPFVRGLTPDGRIFDIARNILNGQEFAGACFSPDGQTLFVNIQGDTAGEVGALGMTLAIWGPWEIGAV